MDHTDQSLEFSTAQPDNAAPSNMSQIPLEPDNRHFVVKKTEPLRWGLDVFVGAVSSTRKAEVEGWDAPENVEVCSAALQSLNSPARVEIEKVDHMARGSKGEATSCGLDTRGARS